jgi:hypothetical protein
MAIGHPAFCRRGRELTGENEEPLKSQTAVSGIYFMMFQRFFAESIGGVFSIGIIEKVFWLNIGSNCHCWRLQRNFVNGMRL